MPKKKTEEIEETQAENAAEETTAGETEIETLEADAAETDDAPKSAEVNDSETAGEEPSIIESVAETVTSAVGAVVDTAAGVFETVAETVGLGAEKTTAEGRGNRAEKVGVVWSDKMQKTVVVRVDRLVKHSMYRKYVRRKKKFMAHDELGATVGDKVRIMETRPLSARKRWRVVEIIQKAEK
jgi:small subunit ribosomal protein S17